MTKLETQLPVPYSASVFTFTGARSPGFWRRVSQSITKRPQKEKNVCVYMCILLGFELLLVLEQNFFYSCTFTFFTWSHSGEAPVNMALRGE